jgi:hypothetical protein
METAILAGIDKKRLILLNTVFVQTKIAQGIRFVECNRARVLFG